eukprot:5546448-Pyramimonas_sp.AAC.2
MVEGAVASSYQMFRGSSYASGDQRARVCYGGASWQLLENQFKQMCGKTSPRLPVTYSLLVEEYKRREMSLLACPSCVYQVCR